MLDKNQIQAIFLLEFKMGHKSAEATCNINNTFGPGTANKYIAPWWFKRFCKGDKSLEDEECSDWPSEIEMTNWEDHFTTTGEVAKELSADHSMVIQYLKQIGKVKNLHKWVPH